MEAMVAMADLVVMENHSFDNRSTFCSSTPSSSLLRICRMFSEIHKTICQVV